MRLFTYHNKTVLGSLLFLLMCVIGTGCCRERYLDRYTLWAAEIVLTREKPEQRFESVNFKLVRLPAPELPAMIQLEPYGETYEIHTGSRFGDRGGFVAKSVSDQEVVIEVSGCTHDRRY